MAERACAVAVNPNRSNWRGPPKLLNTLANRGRAGSNVAMPFEQDPASLLPSPTGSAGVDIRTLSIRDLYLDRQLAPENGNETILRALGRTIYGLAAALVLEDPAAAERIAPAVFQTLRVRWKKLSKRTLLAVWLFETTLIASREERQRLRLAKRPIEPIQLTLFRLNGLPVKIRDAVVLREIFGVSGEEAGRVLRTKTRRVATRVSKGLKKLQKPLSKTGENPEALLRGITPLAPTDAPERLVANSARTSTQELLQQTISSWRWVRAGRFAKRLMLGLARGVAVLAVVFACVAFLATHGYLMPLFIAMGQRDMVKKHPELLIAPQLWPVTAEDGAVARSTPPRDFEDLFQMTNIWPVRLTFSPEQWRKITPSHVPPVRQMFQNGRIILRNPQARRSGLAGVLGYDFNWVEARLNFAGERFDKVGVRYRGNGTYLNSRYGQKQSLKLDVHKYEKTNYLAGVREVNFLNTIVDYSYVHDALAEDLFRQLGAIGPRTAYAYITEDIGNGKDEPRGLFVAMENIDADFAEHRFGTRKAPIFKPVTYDLFVELGGDWNAYDEIYDLKTKATDEQRQRVMDLAALVTRATDEEFARRVADFLDLDEFAAFLAGHVLLSSYDGFLVNGQNFYVYLDPRSNKFGFVPWDQDHAWGDFGHIGTTEQRENASIWHPCIYDFRFLDRVMKVEAFRQIYRGKLEGALSSSFSTAVLFPKIDLLAKRIRAAVAAESDFRLKRFDQAVSSELLPGSRDGEAEGPGAPVHQIKQFITNRVKSVRDQLDGKSEGARLTGFRN